MAFNDIFTENLYAFLRSDDYQTITALYGTVQSAPGSLSELIPISYNRQRSVNLPIPIFPLILCLLNTTEMTAFRCCCMAFNAIFTENAATILYAILRRSDDYQTITALYGTFQSARGPLLESIPTC